MSQKQFEEYLDDYFKKTWLSNVMVDLQLKKLENPKKNCLAHSKEFISLVAMTKTSIKKDKT